MLRPIVSGTILGAAAIMLTSAGNSQELERIGQPRTQVKEASGCGDSPKRIIVECQPPEIIIQRVGGACAEPSLLQRCNHFRMRQTTWMHGHGVVPAAGIPVMVMPQSVVAQSFVPQSTVQLSLAPQSFVPQALSIAPQALSIAPQAFIPQSFVPQSFVPQSFVPQALVPQAAIQPQATTDSDKMDIKEAVKKLSENLKKASELLNDQAKILKNHDDRISSLEERASSLLEAVKDKEVFAEGGILKVKDKKK